MPRPAPASLALALVGRVFAADPGFPPDFAVALERELAEADRYEVASDGALLVHEGPAPEGPWKVLSRDPAAFGRLLSHLPTAQRVHAWIRAGEARSAPPELRARLRDGDGLLGRKGLAPAFFPATEDPAATTPRPAPEHLDPELDRIEELTPGDRELLRGAPGGALGEALAHADRALALLARMRAEVGGNPARLPGDIDEPLIRQALMFTDDPLRNFLELACESPEHRTRLGPWLAEGDRRARAFLWSAGAAVLPGAPHRDLAGVVLVHLADRLRNLFYAPFGSLPAEVLLGGSPRTPEGWRLLGEVRWSRRNTRAVMGEDIAPALRAQVAAEWQVLEAPPAGRFLARLRGGSEERLSGALELLDDRRERLRYLRWILAFPAPFEEDSRRVGLFRMVRALAGEGGRFGYSADDLRALTRVSQVDARTPIPVERLREVADQVRRALLDR